MLQLVPPLGHLKTALKSCHDKECHLGLKQMLLMAQNGFQGQEANKQMLPMNHI